MTVVTLNPGESLTAVMSGAANTTNPTYAVDWNDVNSPAINQPVGSLAGATPVMLVAAPTDGQRQLHDQSRHPQI